MRTDLNAIGSVIVDAALKVHRALGPGLLESVYEAAIVIELTSRGLRVESQVPIAVIYERKDLGMGVRADLIVEGVVLVELKSVENLVAIHRKTTLNYMHLTGIKLGYLINFNQPLLKDGLERLVNGLDQEPAFRTSRPPRALRETSSER